MRIGQRHYHVASRRRLMRAFDDAIAIKRQLFTPPIIAATLRVELYARRFSYMPLMPLCRQLSRYSSCDG